MLRRQWSLLLNRIRWSWAGVSHVWRNESSFHMWFWANVVSAACAFLLPLDATQRGMILMGGIMILAMECVNTAIERVVDDISDAQRDRAKQAKDAGSAAVALMGVGVGVGWICILWGMYLA